ncbi:MAG: hypothetical protein JW384_01532 [Nitrosomonadaceae bacterium]|nr:hypothetical protein [Nitrosomonadaceae bacterium]
MRFTHSSQWVLTVSYLFHVLLEHFSQHGNAAVGTTQMLLAPIRDGTLGNPSHDVLSFNVIGDQAAVLVPPQILVKNWTILLGCFNAIGSVVGKKQFPGSGVINGNPDLHLIDSGSTNTHEIREHKWMTDFPVVVFFCATFENSALENSPFHFFESSSHVLFLECFGCVKTLGLAKKFKVVTM